MTRTTAPEQAGHAEFRLLAAAAVDGQIDPDDAEALEAHLSTCPSCRSDQRGMLDDHRWLATPGPVSPPHPRVLAAVLREARSSRTPYGSRWASLAAAALVVAVAGLGVVLWSTGPGADLPDPLPTAGPASVTETLANGWSVTASDAWLENGPELALDGDRMTRWISGDYAPAWIEVDLGQPTTLERVELIVEQTPAGDTLHELIAMDADRVPVSIVTLDGRTAQFDELRHVWDAPLRGVRYVRVSTLESPSWVSWREIAIITGGGR